MTMYKVLLLSDFSMVSRHAIAYAQALFADTATHFWLLHAFPAEPTEGFTGGFLLSQQRQSAEESLRDLQGTLVQPPVPTYHTYSTMAMLGDPVSAVETLLTQEHFDLVVVGATGSGRAELFGSVATAMIRHANTAVLVVPTSALIRPLARVVLATDYRSVNDAQSLGLLSDIVSRKAAQLTLLTIENSRLADTHASALSRQNVERALEGLQTDTYCIHDNDVAHGINAYLDAHPVDLLVVLPHHKGILDILTDDSLTRSVAYHPRVPLLTLYDPETSTPVPPPNLYDIPVVTHQ